MEVPIDQLAERVDILRSARQFEPITKGFSRDRKYRVTTLSDRKLLLRVMPIQQCSRKDEEFRLMEQLYLGNVKVPEPIMIGQCEDLSLCYYILSYLEGMDAEEALKDYSAAVQFNIGVEAGKDLLVMHQYEAPPGVAPWYQRITKKHKNYIDAYKKLDTPVIHAEKIMRFIDESEPYLRNRPNRFQHDDFHPANIIVSEGKYAGVIDFNRYDWGDPFHDFVKMAFFSSQISIPFSVGQLRGYFQEQKIPDDFWKIYSVYVAMSIFASVVWTMRGFPENMDHMMDRINRVLEDHKYFEREQPIWFSDW